MIDRRLRSSYESYRLPYTKVTARSAVRTAIGRALSSRYEVPGRQASDLLPQLVPSGTQAGLAVYRGNGKSGTPDDEGTPVSRLRGDVC